ncbi:MAG: hypothetical protein AAF441_27125, partial [Pseudomonadota bacterium]
LKHAFGQVDANDIKFFHLVLLRFLTSLGQNGSVVNQQEGHPIHHLSAPAHYSSVGQRNFDLL